MRSLMTIICIAGFLSCEAQEKITTFNFLQAGAVPKAINERGHNLSNSGITCNITNFNHDKFFRMDATWLVRYLMHGTKDTANFQDSNKLAGFDLPVFTATFGRNIIKGDDFSLGLGLNLDSRTFFSPPSKKKLDKLVDAWNVGIALGMKIRFNKWMTYHCVGGYDFMFTDQSNTSKTAIGRQIYVQNNISFLLKGRFGINLQPDLSFKSFDIQGLKGCQIFNKNIKLGLAYAIQ